MGRSGSWGVYSTYSLDEFCAPNSLDEFRAPNSLDEFCAPTRRAHTRHHSSLADAADVAWVWNGKGMGWKYRYPGKALSLHFAPDWLIKR